MELGEEKLDEAQLRTLSTVDLVKQALGEMKLLARAEILHAKSELREELKEAKSAGIYLSLGLVLASSAVTLFLGALALALPLAPWLALLLVGVVVLLVAGGLAFLGVKHIPTQPLRETTERLKADVLRTRKELQ